MLNAHRYVSIDLIVYERWPGASCQTCLWICRLLNSHNISAYRFQPKQIAHAVIIAILPIIIDRVWKKKTFTHYLNCLSNNKTLRWKKKKKKLNETISIDVIEFIGLCNRCDPRSHQNMSSSSSCECMWIVSASFPVFFFASLSDSRRIPYMKWKYQQWQTSIRPVENEKWKMEKLIFFFLIASGEMKSIDHSVAGRLVVPQSRLTRNDKTFSYLFIMWWIKDERRDYNIFLFTNFAMDFVELQVAIV